MSRIAPGTGAAIRILIVEDEFLIRMMVAESLTDAGFAVTEAASGDEALPLLGAANPPQLLLTDITLPGRLDGLALAAQARVLLTDLPIIFVTGRPDAISPAQLGARDAIVAKPYLPSEIIAVARRLLG